MNTGPITRIRNDRTERRIALADALGLGALAGVFAVVLGLGAYLIAVQPPARSHELAQFLGFAKDPMRVR